VKRARSARIVSGAALAISAVVVVAFAPTSAWADAAQWERWPTAYSVVFPAVSKPTYVRVPLDESIDAGRDGQYPSLRVISGADVETPIALDPDTTAKAPHDVGQPVPIVDSGYVAGSYTQAVLDFGTSGSLHEAVLVVVSPPTYFERVSVEASDDRRTWRAVRDDAVIYAVAGDGGGAFNSGNQTIAFPPTRSRWLRLRVLDGTKRFPITGAFAAPGPVRDALVPVSVAPVASSDGRRSRWTYSFGTARVGVSAVELLGGSSAYSRSLSVETSDDGTTFTQAVGPQTVTSNAGSPANTAFGTLVARAVRVVVDNGDDPPVPGLRSRLLRAPHTLVFLAKPHEQYRLLVSPYVTTPGVYDLGDVLTITRDWHTERVAALSAPFPNPVFRDPRPLTEHFPWLVGAGFAVAAVLLALVALSTVRTAIAQREAEQRPDST
jgi:hypothetical protein